MSQNGYQYTSGQEQKANDYGTRSITRWNQSKQNKPQLSNDKDKTRRKRPEGFLALYSRSFTKPQVPYKKVETKYGSKLGETAKLCRGHHLAV